MKNLRLLFGVALTGVVVAIIYTLFEGAVHHSINYIWDDMFNSDTERLLVVPLALILGFIFFASQHILDSKSENHESHSLGGEPIKPTLRNVAVILFVGFLSLVAGASLGPEAVLVPACTTIGAYIGIKLIDPWLVIKSLQIGYGAERHKILVTSLVHSDKDQVIILFVLAWFFIIQSPSCYICFHTY